MMHFPVSTAFVLIILMIQKVIDAAAITPQYVQFDVEEARGPALHKRTLSENTLIDDYTYYMATLKVGSNGQSEKMLLDTGSSDMFVVDSTSCSSCTSGTFVKSSSTSLKALSKAFTVTYGSGKAAGSWFTDKVVLGGATVTAQQLAVATTYPSKFGILGLGLSPDVIGNQVQYPNFLKSLKTAGVIAKSAFSFFAGAYGKNNGHILFGAVDLAKVSGSLQKVPLVVTNKAFTHATTPTVSMTGLTLDSTYASVASKVLTTTAHNFLVDTGTSFTVFPTDAFNNLVSALKATKSGSYYYVNCGLKSQAIYLTFNFSGIKIKAPISDMIYQTSSTQCILGVSSSTSGYIFGADAIRSTYLVFDYDDYALYIGAANTAAKTSNIQVITSTKVPTS